jgi:hypothetical protein
MICATNYQQPHDFRSDHDRLFHPGDQDAAAGGDAMSTATRTDTQSPALQVADSHDLIRVHGARVNNLKDLSVEIRSAG